MYMLGVAPDLDIAFEDEGERNVARDFMDMVDRADKTDGSCRPVAAIRSSPERGGGPPKAVEGAGGLTRRGVRTRAPSVSRCAAATSPQVGRI